MFDFKLWNPHWVSIFTAIVQKGWGIHCLSKVWNNIIRSEEMEYDEKPTEPAENLLRPAE